MTRSVPQSRNSNSLDNRPEDRVGLEHRHTVAGLGNPGAGLAPVVAEDSTVAGHRIVGEVRRSSPGPNRIVDAVL